MILLTHAVVGAAVGRLFPRYPLVAFFAGVASHFALDAIPHWQYRVLSRKSPQSPLTDAIMPGKNLVRDVIVVSADFLAGLFVAFYFFNGGASLITQSPVFWGAFGGAFPDGLQFLYWLIKKEPLTAVQKFHMRIHASPPDLPRFPGILYQAALIIVAILLSRAFLPV